MNTSENHSSDIVLLPIGLLSVKVQFSPDSVSFCHLVQDLYLYIWNRREEEALAGAQAGGMTWDIPRILTRLGHLACQQQHYALAKARYREALALYRPFGSPTYLAGCLEGYAAVCGAEGHSAQATRLCAAAALLREQAQTPLPPAEREAFEQVVARAKATLDETTFAYEWTVGAALTYDEAIDYALADACT